MTFIYDKGIPAHVLNIIKPFFDEAEDFIPSWCTKIIVQYSEEMTEDRSMDCESEYHYRTILITVYPRFLNKDFTIKANQHYALHEICHAIMRPYVSVAESIVEYYVTDDRAKAFVLDRLTKAEEEMVEDLSYSMKKALDKNVDSVVSCIHE